MSGETRTKQGKQLDLQIRMIIIALSWSRDQSIIQGTLGRFFELAPHQANHGYLTRLLAGSFFCGQLSGSACFRLMKSGVRSVFFGDRYDAGDDSKRTSTNGSLKSRNNGRYGKLALENHSQIHYRGAASRMTPPSLLPASRSPKFRIGPAPLRCKVTPTIIRFRDFDDDRGALFRSHQQ